MVQFCSKCGWVKASQKREMTKQGGPCRQEMRSRGGSRSLINGKMDLRKRGKRVERRGEGPLVVQVPKSEGLRWTVSVDLERKGQIQEML